MSAEIAVQKAIRARLVSTGAVTALVPAGSILDVNQRPAPLPSIIIGEGMAMEGDRIDRRDQIVILDLHIWKQEPGLRGVKEIAGAVRAALHSERLAGDDDFHFADCRVTRSRSLRDPGGEVSHQIVTVETKVCEVS